MQSVENLLLSNIAAIVVTAMFMIYLYRRDRNDKEMRCQDQAMYQERHKEFNLIITNHLNHANEVIKENTTAYKELSVQMQKLSDIIDTKIDN